MRIQQLVRGGNGRAEPGRRLDFALAALRAGMISAGIVVGGGGANETSVQIAVGGGFVVSECREDFGGGQTEGVEVIGYVGIGGGHCLSCKVRGRCADWEVSLPPSWLSAERCFVVWDRRWRFDRMCDVVRQSCGLRWGRRIE